MVEVKVEDNGPGIEPRDLSNLFRAFFTSKREGMGVGLPISRTIIEAQGGQIWAANRPEGGACFTFTLPR
jgi:signal transduction histidine kinase